MDIRHHEQNRTMENVIIFMENVLFLNVVQPFKIVSLVCFLKKNIVNYFAA